MNDEAIPASKDRLLFFVGFRQTVIILQVSFSVAFRSHIWNELAQTSVRLAVEASYATKVFRLLHLLDGSPWKNLSWSCPLKQLDRCTLIMVDLANSHFSTLSVTPLSSRRRKTALTLASCSSDVSPTIIMSTIMHCTPSISSGTVCIILWCTRSLMMGAEVIPNEKRRKHIHPL